MLQQRPLGCRLAAIRLHRMISQGELAAMIGASKSAIFRYEHDHTAIGPMRLVQLAWALQCEVADFLAPADAALPRIKPHGTRPPGVRLLQRESPPLVPKARPAPGFPEFPADATKRREWLRSRNEAALLIALLADLYGLPCAIDLAGLNDQEKEFGLVTRCAGMIEEMIWLKSRGDRDVALGGLASLVEDIKENIKRRKHASAQAAHGTLTSHCGTPPRPLC
jgi:transcriptional regulator with XRE-family HTH domain